MDKGVSVFLILVAFAIGSKIAVDVVRKRTELVSIRTFFMIGFILFQCTSAAIPLWTNYYPRYPINDPAGTGLRYAGLVSMFLLLFFVSYDKGPFVRKLAAKLPNSSLSPGVGKQLGLAAVLVVIAVALRFGVMIPLIGILANFAGLGIASVAAGVAGWIWAPRLLNPVVAMIAGAVILAALAVTITGTFGRRGLVSVCACTVWGMYYSHFRTIAKVKYMPTLGVVTVAGTLFLALFSSVRAEAQNKNFGPVEYVKLMATRADLREGMALLAGGQETGHISLWLTEEFPERTEYENLLGLAYGFMVPIPRGWWEEKPMPISKRIPHIANLRKVDLVTLTIGPGVIGTAWADGGWWPVALYALIFGLSARLLDQWVANGPTNLFVVLPVGSAVGQVLAIPRGEVGLFAFMYVFSLISTWIMMTILAKVLRFERSPSAALAAAPVAAVAHATALDAHGVEGDEDFEHHGAAGAVWDEPQDVQEWNEPDQRLDWAELDDAHNPHDWSSL
ncbi:MAG: hypothetical protein KDA20_04810 [Phycisphaerales bacterium]|nr:hypothetical protein [Phycisphaerales bacterium]